MKKISGLFLGGAAAMILLVLAGCQSIEDQIAKTITEKAVESASGGQVKLDTSGGTMNIKTPEGEMKVKTGEDSMTITTPEGEAVFGGGDTRPTSVHPDLPNLEGAAEFSWAGSKEGGMFTYNIKGTDHKDVCKKQMDLLAASGWSLKEDFVMEFEGMTTRTMEKTGFSLSLSCSSDTDDNMVTVVMIKGAQD